MPSIAQNVMEEEFLLALYVPSQGLGFLRSEAWREVSCVMAMLSAVPRSPSESPSFHCCFDP